MNPIKFTVIGDPAPGGSKTIGYKLDRKGAVLMCLMNTTRFGRVLRPIAFLRDSGKNNAKWKRVVERTARAHMQTEFLTPFPKGVAIKFSMTFFRVRPKNHYGTGKNAETLNAAGLATPYPISNPDLTKTIRSTEDALKGVCWHDDNHVVEQHTYKLWGPTAGVVIVIEAMPNEAELFGGEG